MDSTIYVKLNDAVYSGWQEATVTRSIEQGVSSFQLVLSDPDTDSVDLLKVKPGDKVQVLIDNTLVISGYIDEFSVAGDATSHGYHISGRSKTKDLVDCSTTQTQQIKNMTLEQVVNQFASEYGVKVKIKAPGNLASTTIPEYQVDQNGSTPFQAIQKLAEKYKLLITDTPEGDLLLTNIGSDITKNEIKHSFTENTAVLEYERRRTEHERYSKIIVKAQTRSNDNFYGKNANQIYAERNDPDVRRKKVKIIVADSNLSQTEALNRANWEAQSSSGKADTITYKIRNWFGNAGELWRENQLVHVDDDFIDAEGYYVISSVEYSISDGGTIAVLTLNPPEAFQHEPDSTNKRKSKDIGSKKQKSTKNTTKKAPEVQDWEKNVVSEN